MMMNEEGRIKNNNINIYIKVLNEKTKFPKCFWSYETVKEVGTYLFNEILKWDNKYILENINKDLIIEYGLETPLKKIFQNKVYEMVNYILGIDYRQWEYKKIPALTKSYWEDESKRRSAFIWLCKKTRKARKSLKEKDFIKYGLEGLYWYVVENKVQGINIDNSIEMYEKLLKGEIKRMPLKFWDDDTIKEVGNYIFFKKIKFKDNDEVVANLKIKVLREYKLVNLMRKRFNGSLSELVNFILDTNYNPWEFKSVKNKFWDNEENRELAAEWLAKKMNKNKSELGVSDYIQYGIRCAYKVEHKSNNEEGIIKVIELEDERRISLSDKWVGKLEPDVSFLKVYPNEDGINMVRWDESHDKDIKDKIETIKEYANKTIKDITEDELNYIEYIITREYPKEYDEIRIILRNELYVISLTKGIIKKMNIINYEYN